MTDYYLKFATEKAAKDALTVAGYVSDGEVMTASHEHAIDLVGQVVKTPAETDAEGNITKAAVMETGYFVNIRTEYLPKSLWGFRIKPTRFYRAWADTPVKIAEQEAKCLSVIAEVKEKAIKDVSKA